MRELFVNSSWTRRLTIMDGNILEFLLYFYWIIYLFVVDKLYPLLIIKKRLKTYLFVKHLGKRLLFLLLYTILISIITIYMLSFHLLCGVIFAFM